MFYVKNLPGWERMLRMGGGLVAAAYAVSALEGVTKWSVVAMAAGLALSGLIGFCPMCALAGRRLEKQRGKSQ